MQDAGQLVYAVLTIAMVPHQSSEGAQAMGTMMFLVVNECFFIDGLHHQIRGAGTRHRSIANHESVLLLSVTCRRFHGKRSPCFLHRMGVELILTNFAVRPPRAVLLSTGCQL